MDEGDKEYGNVVCADDEEAAKASWMRPLRKLMKPPPHHHHHEQDHAVLPGTSSPMKKIQYNLMGSPTPPKIPRRRLSLSTTIAIATTPERSSNGQHSNPVPITNDENVEEVYENVEVLLEALRMERHQEKLEAQQEIQALKEKIAVLERRENQDKPPLPNTHHFDANMELAESLLETLALLEDECEEWQNNAKRKSLDTITNTSQNQIPTPESNNRRNSSTPYKTPRQKLATSVRRLRAMESQLKEDCQRRSLAPAFEQEVNDKKQEQNDALESLQKELSALNDELANKTKKHEKQFQELKKESFKHQQECAVLSSKLQAGNMEKKKRNASINREIQKNQIVSKHLEQLQKELAAKESEMVEYVQKQEKQEMEKERLMEEYENMLNEKDQDLHILETTLMEMHVQLKKLFSERNRSETALKNDILSLREQLENLEYERSEKEMESNDLKMQLAIEKHSKLSSQVKIESAQFQIQKQGAIINTLTKSLEDARFQAQAYSYEVQELQKKLDRALKESSSVLEERNELLLRQSMEIATLKDTFGECIMGAY
mgnify:CR=1 FL=1